MFLPGFSTLRSTGPIGKVKGSCEGKSGSQFLDTVNRKKMENVGKGSGLKETWTWTQKMGTWTVNEEKDWNDGKWMEAVKNKWGMVAGTKD